MSDLIDRLRGAYQFTERDGTVVTRHIGYLPPIHGEAADAIERLESKVKQLEVDNAAMEAELTEYGRRYGWLPATGRGESAEIERLEAWVAELEAENAAMAEELVRAERGDDPCTS